MILLQFLEHDLNHLLLLPDFVLINFNVIPWFGFIWVDFDDFELYYFGATPEWECLTLCFDFNNWFQFGHHDLLIHFVEESSIIFPEI